MSNTGFEVTAVAFVLGQENTRAAIALAACQSSVIALHLLVSALWPRFGARSRAGAPHTAFSVLIHKAAHTWSGVSGSRSGLSADESRFSASLAYAANFLCVQSLSIAALLLIFSLGADLNPGVTSDIGHQRMGRFAVVYAAIALALPTRNSFVGILLLNTSFKDAIKWHTWTASAAVLLALVHSVAYFMLWIPINFVEASLSSTQIRNRFGLAASSLMLLAFLTSSYPMRRYAYHTFYSIHILTAPIIITLVYLHTPSTALPYLTGPLALYIIDKGIRLIKSTRRVKVLNVASLHDAAKTCSTTMLTVCAPPLCQHEGFQPGQFVFVNIPEISSTKWHPVSLSSHSPSFSDTDTIEKRPCCSKPITLSQEHPCTGCRIVLSGRGPFPRALNEIATSRLLCNPASLSPLIMHMDGPYGQSHAYSYFSRNTAGAYMYIAGGIGITPILSLLLNAVSNGASGCCHDRSEATVTKKETHRRERILVWSVKRLKDIGWALEDLTACTGVGVAVLIRVTNEHGTDDSFRMDREDESVHEDAETGLTRGEDEVLLSGWIGANAQNQTLSDVAVGKVSGVNVVFGRRPDYGQIFRDLKKRRQANASVVGDCGVIVSGPVELVASVQRHATRESDKTCLFHVFTESFEL